MSYYGQPMLQEPVWIWTVPLYFYAGGAAGACAALGAAAQIGDPRSLPRFATRCRWISAGGGAIGSVLLILDLGRKSRFLYMLRVFRPTSPMSVGSWLLAAFSTSAAASLIFPGVGLATGVLGLPLAGYTAVLLSNTAVPVWQRNRRTLPYLFIASSLVSAASLFELMPLNAREHRLVKTCAVAGGASELISMFVVERGGGIGGVLWTSAKVFSVSSLAISLLPGRSRKKRFISGTLGTLASLCVRFAVMRAGKRQAEAPAAPQI